MAELRKRRVMVVGGANGIGREISLRLATIGTLVTAVDRDRDALDALAREHPLIDARALDITDRAAVGVFVSECEVHGERWKGLVMSAAVHGACPIAKMSDAFIDRVIAVNLGSHVKLLRDLLPHLEDGARIVGISSNSAEIGIPMEALYAGSKAAMERIYEALAIEMAHRRIRPLVVQTGNVNTGFNESNQAYVPDEDGYVADAWRAVLRKIDSRNGISPGRVADAVIRLLDARRPPFRTLVGQNAYKTHWARRLLGTTLSLRIVPRILGIRGPS
jgi:NAD(P)-dependent dehydrogenase (short-subunit alcohol dehydrogenase family)